MNMFCIECETPLSVIPIFNDDKDTEFANSLLFCSKEDCKRHGLLTVTFKSAENVEIEKKKNAKGKRKNI